MSKITEIGPLRSAIGSFVYMTSGLLCRPSLISESGWPARRPAACQKLKCFK